ncbi:hypothetical protein A0O36_02847 [Piscirickettsiaceae bacterium NZ-RLO1]|nr:hypothetical protein A0O36_02847 [Piscirickettsiaceae bacterium NZ-RLO1]
MKKDYSLIIKLIASFMLKTNFVSLFLSRIFPIKEIDIRFIHLNFKFFKKKKSK